MANRWRNNGNSDRLYFLGSKITADGDCSHEIKRHLFLGKKVIRNQRHYFADKSPSCQSYCFSSSHVWMWELDYKESWVPKNWCFWTMVWRLLRVPWTARRSNQSVLKEISPEYSVEGLMLKLKFQSFGHLIWRTNWKRPWCWERLKAGGEGDDRGWDGWMASLDGLDGHEFEQTRGVGDGQGSLACCSPWGHKESDITEQLNWTESNQKSWGFEF